MTFHAASFLFVLICILAIAKPTQKVGKLFA